MPKKRESRVYAKNGRYYGDFRDYADVGGKREALVPEGATNRQATTDHDVAAKLAAARVQDLENRRRNRNLLGVESEAKLGEFASRHLVLKAQAGTVTDSELAALEVQLRRAVEFFGAGRTLASIGVRDIESWIAALRKVPGRRRGSAGLAPETIRKHLTALSNLYRRAGAEAVVTPGFNPPAALMDKPSPDREEARWLEVPEAALLLEAARFYEPPRDDYIGDLHALLATFLLTGGRKSEVLGLAITDISFDRRVVTFRPNQWRRLKNRTSHRSVRLWPQLYDILQRYVFGGDAPRTNGLLFPSPRTGAMIDDLQKALDSAAERAGWQPGEITSKVFRHTYCSARLQTLEGGAAVSPFTVARELGHGGMSMVNRVYGHLGEVRHRSEAVEYRVDQHTNVLGERIAALRAWKPRRCRGVTTAGEPCGVHQNLSDDDLCIWHDPKRREEARRARSHPRKTGLR